LQEYTETEWRHVPPLCFGYLLFHLPGTPALRWQMLNDLTDLTMTLNDMPASAVRAQALIAHRQKTL